MSPSSQRAGLPALLLCALLCAPVASGAELPAPETLRQWVEGFVQSPRGPFRRVRWFCEDGSVLPPRAFACNDHGGGIQHGEWNHRARALREGGYEIANVLAEIDPERFVGDDPELEALAQILIERFLIAWDDGWIFRGARSYRGALQVEDEEAGARRLMLAMLRDPAWLEPERYLLLRESARLLPLQRDPTSAASVRAQALRLAERDPAFERLRAKIHNVPDPSDAERVRQHAAARGLPALAGDYAGLAKSIDTLYAPGGLPRSALAMADVVDVEPMAVALRGLGEYLAEAKVPEDRLAGAARLSGLIRKHFARVGDPTVAIDLLLLSLAVESEAYAAGTELIARLDGLDRRKQLRLLDWSSEGLYGAGLIGLRQLAGLKASLSGLDGKPRLGTYRRELDYVARAPGWADRQLALHFGEAVARLATIEDQALLFTQDRLRGSPLLFYGQTVDGLVRDAHQLARVRHELFGQRVGSSLRALNPGLARGVLHLPPPRGEPQRFDPEGIYVLPETTADLPPVAGILTRGEGSVLSHVQLLARNLGIPNVVVGRSAKDEVLGRLGSRVVLAVSPGGVVQLADDGPEWDERFEREAAPPEGLLELDLVKLDLSATAPIPLSELRSDDSGRTVGPKGANLGELRHHFGDAVPDGFVIPFGAFRRLLDQPIEPGGPPAFQWMKVHYDAIGRAGGDPETQKVLRSRFLERLRRWIERTDPGPVFRAQVRTALRDHFGPDGRYGVFVRSDTNVEDLPGFTGAGLNLTVPNVVGSDAILRAIRRVWASPFTERAVAWRQDHVDRPEYVLPAVVVQRAFPAEVSGVLVTTDVESGAPGWLTIAVSEGVGGVVEGQQAESLRVRRSDGQVRLLEEATASERKLLAPFGGVRSEPVRGRGALLSDPEILQLRELADAVESFPALRGPGGRPLPADVEFGFRRGRLALFQIRPFLESRRAQHSAYLRELDASARARNDRPVRLDAIPIRGRTR